MPVAVSIITHDRVLVAFVALILALFLFISHRDKRKLKLAHSGLASLNEAITKQKRQIEEQATRLKVANKLLVRRSRQIKHMNHKLRELVKVKTADLEKTNVELLQEIQIRKSTEEEKSKLVNELLKQNKDLTEFSHITSHNLRAPIASLLGLISIMDEDSLDPYNKEILKHIRKASDNLDSITRDLNIILGVKENIDEELEFVDFKEVLNFTCQTLHRQIKDSKIEISANFSAAPVLFTIKGYMQSIFHQMLSNAIRFKRNRIAPRVELISYIMDDHLVLSIADNGLGIDMNMAESKLFTPYQGFHPSLSGKGIGLYLTKTHIEALGGHIEVHSVENQGSTFTLYFPVKKHLPVTLPAAKI
jgi:signal transduction histidine kinase